MNHNIASHPTIPTHIDLSIEQHHAILLPRTKISQFCLLHLLLAVSEGC
jgi:hypothetical protein